MMSELRQLRYEGTRAPYFYLCMPREPGEKSVALLQLLADYGYRFFMPLPGDENIDADTGFFFRDDRMELASRVIVLLPEAGGDCLAQAEEQSLRDWLNHHAPSDVLTVHLGEGEAAGTLATLVNGGKHLRPVAGESHEDYCQRLLNLLLPPEYDPARDKSLQATSHRPVDEPQVRALGKKASGILTWVGTGMLLLPPLLSAMLILPWENLRQWSALASDLLLLSYGVTLILTMMLCDGFAFARNAQARQIIADCPDWYGWLHRTACTLRMGNMALMAMLLSLRVLLEEGTVSLDVLLVRCLWRSVLFFGIWMLLEAALCIVIGDGLHPARKQRGRDTALMGCLLFGVLIVTRVLLNLVPDLCTTELAATGAPLICCLIALCFFACMGSVCRAWLQLRKKEGTFTEG